MILYVATSNPGKLRDFAAAATDNITLTPLPGKKEIPAPRRRTHLRRQRPPQSHLLVPPRPPQNRHRRRLRPRSRRSPRSPRRSFRPLRRRPKFRRPTRNANRRAQQPLPPLRLSENRPSTKSPTEIHPPATTASSPPPVTGKFSPPATAPSKRRNPLHPSRYSRRLRPTLLLPRTKQDHGRARHQNQTHLQSPWPSLRRTPHDPFSVAATPSDSITSNLIAQTSR